MTNSFTKDSSLLSLKCNFICCKIIDTTSNVPKSKLDTME